MKLKSIINILPTTFIERKSAAINDYCQLDYKKVKELLIKFIKKGELGMPRYEIVSDVNNEIVYNEINEGFVNREEVANYRARIEALKAEIDAKNAELAELESLVEKGEFIVKLADEKKVAEETVETETPVEEVNE